MADYSTAAQTDVRPGPVWALVRRWPIAVLLAALGAVAGVLYAGTQPAFYTAEARLAVGYGDLSAGAIAGFPTAAEDLASNYSRYVNDQGLIGRNLSGKPMAGDVSISATPIPSSNVIRVIAVSQSSTTARQAATQTAKDLIQAVNQPAGEASPQQLLDKFNQAALAAAQASSAQSEAERDYNQALDRNGTPATRLSQLREVVDADTAASDQADLQKSSMQSEYLDAVQASRSADLVLVTAGRVTDDDRTPRQQRFGLIGLVAGLALALVIASLLERRRLSKLERADRAAPPRHADDDARELPIPQGDLER